MLQDDRIAQLTDIFIEDLRAPVETSLRQLVGQMMDLAEQERAAALAALRRELEELHAGQLEAIRAEMRQQHDEALNVTMQQAATEREERLQSLSDELLNANQATIAELTNRITLEREAAAQSIRDQLAAEKESALASLRETMERERDAALAERDESRDRDQQAALVERTETLMRERDAARAAIAELTDQLAEATAQRQHFVALADAESAAAEQVSSEGTEVLAGERQYGLECGSRLVDAIRSLDEARSLTEVLGVLTNHVAPEELRVAVLLVQGTRLRAWRLSGMGDVPPASVDIPLDRAGLLGRAVETGTAFSTTEMPVTHADALPACMVPPPDRVGLALPVLVGGRVVALVYADDATGERTMVPSNWPEMSEVVVRHAGRCLEALTLARANGFQRAAAADAPSPAERAPAFAPAAAQPANPPSEVGESLREHDEAQEEESARRHARLLISEIKLYNEALVEEGRRSGNLLGLLGPEIERARRLYEDKIPASVRARVTCFDEELVRTLADGDRALLGQMT